jgi:hypothetical protein
MYEKITAEDLNHAASKYFDVNHLSVALFLLRQAARLQVLHRLINCSFFVN